MIWSLLAPFKAKIGPGEAQRNEPGINALDACGPADVSAIMQLLGYPDVEPQDLMGAKYRGTTTPGQLATVIAEHYPSPPNTAIWYPGDPVAVLQTLGKQRMLTITLGWADGSAVLQTPRPTSVGHYMVPLEDDGSGITVWNPEWGTYERFYYATFRQIYAGVMLVVQRAIPEELFMEQDVNNALRKIALNSAAAAAGVSTADKDLNPVWEVIATDFSNLGDVTAQYIAAKKSPVQSSALPAGTKLALAGTLTVE